MYRELVYPLLRSLDPERAHDLAIRGLEVAQALPPGRAFLRALAGRVPASPLTVCGLRFPNRLGVAAGFDKDVRVSHALGLLGFGHVEAGTLTPRPQPGNPKPRVFRLEEDRALINRMGFPNRGVRAAVRRLRRLKRDAPRGMVLGVSLGKQKETPLEDAARDYIAVMNRIWPHADYLAVNISSPNTPGLRELQGGDYLADLCRRLVRHNDRLDRRLAIGRRPLLVKIAPDMEPGELDNVLDIILEAGIDGIIATNTTLSREGLRSPRAAEEGGLSGAPLARRSTDFIARIRHRAGPGFPIIGAGGIFTPEDALEKIEAGADLIQVYTSFVYGGPTQPARLLRGMEKME